VARTRRQAEEFFGPRRSQPLIGDRQPPVIEVVAARIGGEDVRRQRRRRRFERWQPRSIRRAQPAVVAPRHQLDRGLAAQHAAPAIPDRPSAEIHHVGRAVRGVDQVRVAGALQQRVGAVPRTQDVDVGVQLVGPVERRRPGHGDGMAPRGAPLSGDQVVVAVALVEVRRLGQAERRAAKNVAPLADERTPLDRILLKHDPREAVLSGPMIPEHVEQVLPPVVIVEE
jgi:hypothetical protein